MSWSRVKGKTVCSKKNNLHLIGIFREEEKISFIHSKIRAQQYATFTECA